MLLTVITFIIILSILVFVHELGHFLAARAIGVAVEEFGLGLPPRIIGKKIKETVYSLNWLPIGGFVKLAGEDEEVQSSKSKGKSSKELFWARSKKERAVILISGVGMNFLLAVGITAFLLTQGVPMPTDIVRIERVISGSPAEAVGLRVKDTIAALSFRNDRGDVEEKSMKTPKDLIDTTKGHLGEEITLTIKREGQVLSVPVVPRSVYPEGEGPMGVAISNIEITRYPIWEAPGRALSINIGRVTLMISTLATPIVKLLTFQSVCGQVAGPIGIARVTGQAVKYGFLAVLEFMSILSLNLAVLNILPVPALDGGRLAFVFLEKFMGRKIRPAFERSAHQIGMLILLGLILLTSISDIFCPALGN
ncbi:MAG: M50 family metallopeptidase [bacterium]|nr:M50 family metallopeptidase [bacterium]